MPVFFVVQSVWCFSSTANHFPLPLVFVCVCVCVYALPKLNIFFFFAFISFLHDAPKNWQKKYFDFSRLSSSLLAQYVSVRRNTLLTYLSVCSVSFTVCSCFKLMISVRFFLSSHSLSSSFVLLTLHFDSQSLCFAIHITYIIYNAQKKEKRKKKIIYLWMCAKKNE